MSLPQYNRTWMDLSLAACGFAVWAAMAGCDGSATQTTTGKGIEGVLVDDHGNPVNGATVKAWPAAYGPIRAGMEQDSGQAATALTDAHGHYAFTNLDVGIYNLFGAHPSNHAMVLIPRVKYLEQAADLGTDTLKAPGAIVGEVRVDGGAPPLTFCYLEGSSYAAISDSAGRFVLPDLAEGQYRLNYFANGYAAAVDSVVIVRSGDTTTLAAKTLAPDLALQPPAPQGITAVYDSVHGVVNLKWNAVHVADLKEYSIMFDDAPDSTPTLVHAWATADTVFSDDVMGYYGIYQTGTEPFTRTYWVRARDMEGNLSAKPAQPVTVRITDPTIFQTRFTMHPIIDSAGQVVCKDTLAFALDVTSSPDSLLRVQWMAEGFYHNSDNAGSGYSWNSPESPTLAVSIGAPHRDTLYFTHRTLDSLGTSGSQVGFDSVLVRAVVVSQGALVHMVTAPVIFDSSGCYHPHPTTERSRGEPAS